MKTAAALKRKNGTSGVTESGSGVTESGSGVTESGSGAHGIRADRREP